MNTLNIHLVIVTGYAQANLIPIIQFKPDVVVLIISNDVKIKEVAKEFDELLQMAVPNTLIKTMDNVPSSGLNAIEQKALSIYNDLQHEFPRSVITYHATGGTKLMALGFCSVFAKDNNVVVYTDTANSQIEFIYPRNRSPIPSQDVLKVETYLRSLGFSYLSSSSDEQDWKDQAQQHNQLTEWLAQKAASLNWFLGKMNGLAGEALDKNKTNIIEPNKTILPDFAERNKPALKKLKQYGVIQWDQANPCQITFNSINGAKYISGFWLEEYVWLMAKDLGISEVKSNVEFSRGMATNKNEMDCIAVHNNRLLAIECKTATLMNKDTRDTNNILLKLEALGKGIGGLYHKEWLVSARPVPLEVAQRAEAAQIKIIAPNQLTSLRTELEKWRDAKG